MQQFVEAAFLGNMEGLIALLSHEIVLYADGGGRAVAVPNPIHGPEHVARFVLGARKKLVPGNLVRRMMEINGQPGIASYYPDGRPFSILTIDVAEGRIRKIYIVTNPDKLAGLPRLPTVH